MIIQQLEMGQVRWMVLGTNLPMIHPPLETPLFYGFYVLMEGYTKNWPGQPFKKKKNKRAKDD